MIRLLLSTFALLALCDSALAWGDLGHKVICEIAFQLVQPDTRAAVRRLIESDAEFRAFADSCVFPDHPRRRTSDECPQADRCVLTAILADSKVLASKAETDADRLIALKSLEPWVGDIHQPLHVSFGDDRGGNNISVSGQ
jgi:hypothetical protein